MSKFHIEKIIATLALVKRWGVKGALAILDQTIFSSANFIVSILLAKWLGDKDFGGFAIGLTIITFFMQVYTSFSLETISVIGPSGYHDRLYSYLMGQIRLLFLLSISLGILLGLIALATLLLSGNSENSSILFFSGVCLPFILFPLLMRRIFYVLLKPGFALVGSVIYFFGLIFIFYFTNQFDILTGINSLFIISIASFSSGLIMLLLLKNNGYSEEKIDLLIILSETWSFGKWLIISGIFIGLATQSQVYLVGVLSSTEDAGAVRILQTFIQPAMLIFTAFSSLVTPAIVNDFVSRKYNGMRRKIFLFTLSASIVALLYEYLLFLFGSYLNNSLFGEKYSAYSNQILIWGFVPILWALFWGGSIALQAIQKPQIMVIISSLWAFISLISGWIFIPFFGVWGATISIVLGFVVALISVWLVYWTIVHRKYMRENVYY